MTLEFVKEQTPDLCLIAVKNDWRSLQYVKEQTPEMCLIALQQSVTAFLHINEQTPEICRLAVRQEGTVLRFVKEQTLEICLEATKQTWRALKYVDESFQTPEMCLECIEQNLLVCSPPICTGTVPVAYTYIKKPTLQMCLKSGDYRRVYNYYKMKMMLIQHCIGKSSNMIGV